MEMGSVVRELNHYSGGVPEFWGNFGGATIAGIFKKCSEATGEAGHTE